MSAGYSDRGYARQQRARERELDDLVEQRKAAAWVENAALPSASSRCRAVNGLGVRCCRMATIEHDHEQPRSQR